VDLKPCFNVPFATCFFRSVRWPAIPHDFSPLFRFFFRVAGVSHRRRYFQASGLSSPSAYRVSPERLSPLVVKIVLFFSPYPNSGRKKLSFLRDRCTDRLLFFSQSFPSLNLNVFAPNGSSTSFGFATRLIRRGLSPADLSGTPQRLLFWVHLVRWSSSLAALRPDRRFSFAPSTPIR